MKLIKSNSKKVATLFLIKKIIFYYSIDENILLASQYFWDLKI